MCFRKLKPIGFWEWLACAPGMFFMGLGAGYLKVSILDYGIGLFVLGLILETPAFYLLFKHRNNAD